MRFRFKFILFSILSGLLTGICFNYSWLSFLVWFSLIPLLFVLYKSSYKEAFLYSFICGIVFFSVVIFWVGYVSKLGFIFLSVYLSLYWVFFGLAAKRYLGKTNNLFIIPFLWVFCEYLRTNFGGFGWALLGYSQYENLPIIQAAEVFGVWIISFLVVCANLLIFRCFVLRGKWVVLKQAVVFVVLLSAIFIYGFLSLSSRGFYSGPDKVKISLVQPDIKEIEKQNYFLQEKVVQRLSRLTRNTDKDSLVIFPEAAWPYILDKDNSAYLSLFADSIDRDFIIGSVVKENKNFYNASIFFPKGRDSKQIYKKIKLVPFGEYVPLRRFIPFVDVLNYVGDIDRGSEYSLFIYKKARIANLICFEDVFPVFAREFVNRKGANLLLNITNDGWFRGYPQAVQHLQIAVFRAVEMRMPLVRVANTGISCIISPFGRVLSSVSVDGQKVFVKGTDTAEVSLGHKKSFYCKAGDYFVFAGIVYLFFAIIISRIRRHKTKDT